MKNTLANNPGTSLGGATNDGGMFGADGIKKEIKTEPEDVKPDVSGIKKEMMDTSTPADATVKTETPDVKPDIKKEPEAKESTSSAPPQKPLGANKVKFTKEQLKEALEPPLMKMHAQVRQLSLFLARQNLFVNKDSLSEGARIMFCTCFRRSQKRQPFDFRSILRPSRSQTTSRSSRSRWT